MANWCTLRLEYLSLSTGSHANGLEFLGDKASPAGPNLDDVVEKYKEAITLYGKVGSGSC